MKNITDAINEASVKLKFPYYESYYLIPSQSKNSRQLTLQNVTVFDHTKRTSFQTFDECKNGTQSEADLNADKQWVIVEQRSNGECEIIWIRNINGKEIDLRKK